MRIPELLLLKPKVFPDKRGFFFEGYRQKQYQEWGISHPFVQDNISFSIKHTIRGLHFQKHPGQAKLVTCLQGEIWDVAVDIRPESPTFLQWEAVHLSDQNHHQLYIPVGFAHGFCALSETALVHYKVSHEYDSKTECSIRWDDPLLQILWPVKEPILSERDQQSGEVLHVLDYRR